MTSIFGRMFKKPAPTDLPWMAEARKVIGLHEVRNRDQLAAWLRSDGRTLSTDPGSAPWCGDFVDTALALALPGEPRPGPLGVNPYWARNWLHLGRSCRPCYGAVLVFQREGGGHVGFAMGEDTANYHVLGGNQGDMVSVTRISKARLIGARWPGTAAQAPGAMPQLSPGGAPVSTGEA